MKKQNKKTEQAKSFFDEMNKLAEELYAVRMNLRTREEKFDAETKTLYDEEALLKKELIERLKSVNLSSVKVSNGDAWYISKRPGVVVLNEALFNRWALENRLAKPDLDLVKARLKTMVKEGKELPSMVEFIVQDTISIRKAKNETSIENTA